MITINAFGTALTQDERFKLYPKCGHLYPDGLQELRRADSLEGVRDVAAHYPVSHIFICPIFFYYKKNISILDI